MSGGAAGEGRVAGDGSGPGEDAVAGEPTAEDGATGVEKRAGDGLDARGGEGRGDDVGSAGSPTDDYELLGRVFLTRVVEPGDETGGRWVRERGVAEVVRRLREGGRPLPGVSAKRWAGLRARAVRADPRRDLAVARAAGARFVTPGTSEWPGQLDDLGDARPLGLWVRGRPNLRVWALRSVAVVGARACTEYGAHMAATLAADLAERGWVVVSGGAYGIDGAAHRGALGAGGATAAVLACGVDRPYPPGHAKLISRIAEQGLVIGELPPGDHPTPSRFILRNRVIAALTRGTVVVEAAYRSGSLVTARAAQRLGRHTMGVPGPATSALSGESTSCCAATGSSSGTPPRSSNWSVTWASCPRTGAGRCSPPTCWNTAPDRCWPGSPREDRRPRPRWRAGPRPHRTTRSRDCTSFEHLVTSNDTATAGS